MGLRKQREKILEFQKDYKEYLDLKTAKSYTPQQQTRMMDLRSSLNRAIPVVTKYINKVGEPITIHYAPPPIVGGFTGQLDLLANIFNPSIVGVQRHTLDMIDRALGRYDYLIQVQWKTWINPFHWVGEIIRLPFHLFRFSGFNASKLEFSIFGKVYKFAAGIVAFFGGLIKLYEFLKPFLQAKGLKLP